MDKSKLLSRAIFFGVACLVLVPLLSFYKFVDFSKPLELSTVLLFLGVAGLIFFGDRLLKGEHELMPLKEWKQHAVNYLKNNNPKKFDETDGDGKPVWGFEAALLGEVPAGVLWVFKPGSEERFCAFGAIEVKTVDAREENFLVSDLVREERHLRLTGSKNLVEVACKYLGKPLPKEPKEKDEIETQKQEGTE
jgi:hypothetical protein